MNLLFKGNLSNYQSLFTNIRFLHWLSGRNNWIFSRILWNACELVRNLWIHLKGGAQVATNKQKKETNKNPYNQITSMHQLQHSKAQFVIKCPLELGWLTKSKWNFWFLNYLVTKSRHFLNHQISLRRPISTTQNANLVEQYGSFFDFLFHIYFIHTGLPTCGFTRVAKHARYSFQKSLKLFFLETGSHIESKESKPKLPQYPTSASNTECERLRVLRMSQHNI